MAAATVNVKSDVHSLSVVRDRVRVIFGTGNESPKESWLKVNISGAEGSIEQKFSLLSNSPLQFKLNLSDRERDAKGGDTYYPRGRECAQLFAVLADLRHYVKMEGFDGAKWQKRFQVESLAEERLSKYVAMGAAIARLQAAIVPAAPADVVPPVEASANRMNEEAIPVVATAADPVETVKTGRKARKLV